MDLLEAVEQFAVGWDGLAPLIPVGTTTGY
jgi:hypothetical protein